MFANAAEDRGIEPADLDNSSVRLMNLGDDGSGTAAVLLPLLIAFRRAGTVTGA